MMLMVVLVDMSAYLAVELDLDHVVEMVMVQHYDKKKLDICIRKKTFLCSYSSLIIVEDIGNFCGILVVIIGDVGIDINDGISLTVADDDGGGGIHSLIPFVSFTYGSVCDTYRPKSMNNNNNKINFYFQVHISNSLDGEKDIKLSILN